MNNSTTPLHDSKIQALEAACAAGHPLRFAVLHHTAVEIPHFDLLLKIPGWDKLLTWRVLTPLEVWGAGGETEVGALAVDDHRPLYLSYEGPIAGGRGSVKRIAAGTLQPLSISGGRLELSFPAPVSARLSLPLS